MRARSSRPLLSSAVVPATLDFIKLLAGENIDNYNEGIAYQGILDPETKKCIERMSDRIGKDQFDIFDDTLEIPPEFAKRTVAKFVDKERCGYIIDYLGNRSWYRSESGVYMEPASYSFSITEEMRDAIIYLTHDGHYTEGEI